jgi:hypothetical protein
MTLNIGINSASTDIGGAGNTVHDVSTVANQSVGDVGGWFYGDNTNIGLNSAHTDVGGLLNNVHDVSTIANQNIGDVHYPFPLFL